VLSAVLRVQSFQQRVLLLVLVLVLVLALLPAKHFERRWVHSAAL
jgi:hypothetical protein